VAERVRIRLALSVKMVSVRITRAIRIVGVMAYDICGLTRKNKVTIQVLLILCGLSPYCRRGFFFLLWYLMIKEYWVKKPLDVLNLLTKWTKKRQENFLLITLDGEHKVIKIHHITKGIVNKSLVHPRECFYPAIRDNAVSVVFVHNHPSNNVNLSEEDNEVTLRLKMCSELLGFNMLDNLIISKKGYYSYGMSGEIYDTGIMNKLSLLIEVEKR